ncbi:family 16 glycoside hydrolase [Mucilaginibacter phyllosphaerae]|uniref:DUF1080 domain-containing protein n=1 Tax=Mucilaginibacter phyllosphaerae TaxID=1812349 RepID=A0A4Y8AIN7_9SPHI|nr:family 16 glycoside hydrolase [Mucilaginibacter phyllosphaerae]MBB3968044.1 hypothetical protein [Mucilaginibacter phyllosphaerae]TEW68933.1 DUF1080 domain-containing protein [Mucilaginibacter phyllosphaerae]GGH01602.1 hypothetical protein GCM10007352_03450 [Mucilaginibacter phyllosphaerae]
MNNTFYNKLYLALSLAGVLSLNDLQAQALKSQIALNDLSAFAAPPKNWEVTGNPQADLDKVNSLTAVKGSGILLNRFDEKNPGRDLFFNLQHGDIDIEMDYMMAKGANSGIYLQGRYEVQLLDSWGTVNPRASDNGGIYERWDETRPEGQKGYEGKAPRQNVSRAPGLWQHIKISFQAPRFDDKGLKTANAKILYLWLNGILIQENAELSGPTRGAYDSKESALGPLRLQGDHGAVAFKNIFYTSFDKPHPTVSQLKYTVYKGNFSSEPDYAKLKPVAQGTPPILTSNEVKLDNEFALRYTGMINIGQPGEYTFKLSVPGGKGALKVNGLTAVNTQGFAGTGTVTLPAGNLPFEIFYTKNVDWAKTALGLTVTGPGVREYLLTDANVSSNDAVDPILINASENTILRSFTDLPGGIRVTHGVGVGSPEQLHYTYDLDQGMIVQLWRGGFLDATPMWHDRGDGSSRPAGSVQYFGKPAPALYKLPDNNAAWPADTTGTGYKPKGYVLDSEGRPAFKYLLYGAPVNDASTVLPGGKGLQRQVTLQTPVTGLFLRLAQGNTIQMLKAGLYLVDDQYYISMDDSVEAKPMIRSIGGMQELIVPVKQKLTYSIIF